MKVVLAPAYSMSTPSPTTLVCLHQRVFVTDDTPLPGTSSRSRSSETLPLPPPTEPCELRFGWLNNLLNPIVRSVNHARDREFDSSSTHGNMRGRMMFVADMSVLKCQCEQFQ